MTSKTGILVGKYIKRVQLSDFKGAAALLKEVKRLDPALGWYHHALLYPMHWGRRDAKRERYRKQIEYLKKSLAYDNKNSAALRYLAGIYFQLKEFKEADAAIRDSIKYCRSGLCRADGLRLLGSILIAQGSIEDGFVQLNKVLRMKHRPPFIQLARHFIDYYKATGNQEMVNYWVAKGVKSARIIAASGKRPYGPSDIYDRIIRDLEKFRK